MKEMVEKNNSRSTWDNQYSSLHGPVLENKDSKYANP